MTSFYIGKLESCLEELAHVRIESMHTGIAECIDQHEKCYLLVNDLSDGSFAAICVISVLYLVIVRHRASFVVIIFLPFKFFLFLFNLVVGTAINHTLMDLCEKYAAQEREKAHCEANPLVHDKTGH